MGRGFSRSSPCWGLAPRVCTPNPGTASAGLLGDRTCAAPRLTALQTPPSGRASGRSLPRRGAARLAGATPFSHAASPAEMSASPSAPCRLARSRPRIPAGLPWLSEAAGQEATSWAPRAVTGAETRAPSPGPGEGGLLLSSLSPTCQVSSCASLLRADAGPPGVLTTSANRFQRPDRQGCSRPLLRRDPGRCPTSRDAQGGPTAKRVRPGVRDADSPWAGATEPRGSAAENQVSGPRGDGETRCPTCRARCAGRVRTRSIQMSLNRGAQGSRRWVLAARARPIRQVK